jgi:hypothetical protein
VHALRRIGYLQSGLIDLWAGWAPFGTIGWLFRDIKVEEFIDWTIW